MSVTNKSLAKASVSNQKKQIARAEENLGEKKRRVMAKDSASQAAAVAAMFGGGGT